jgi:hypothetical protein
LLDFQLADPGQFNCFEPADGSGFGFNVALTANPANPLKTRGNGQRRNGQDCDF